MKSEGHRWRPLIFVIGGLVIALLAVAIRLPSCHESYWVDELHSAWAVDDGLDVVAQRAAVGNQTAGYFHLLWCWKALLGQSELMMRLSSVLAAALASFFLVVGVAHQTGRLSAGIIAGGILAIDPNAIFFGCELRPYSLVMLCGVLATWSAMMWLDGDLTGSLGGARYRLSMLFWIGVAALLHPTSLGVLGLLVPTSLLVAWKRNRMHLWRADWVAGLVILVTLGLLAMSSLPDSWARRQQWRAFGLATDPWQLWYAWSWLPIVILPLSLGAVFWALRYFSRGDRPAWVGLLPALVGTLGTSIFFLASYVDWLPLWHRRYFVAALPLLAWSAGVVSQSSLPRTTGGNVVAWLCVLVTLGFLGWYQGTLGTVLSGRWPVQSRGEPWREAVAWVKQSRRSGDAVWLDTGLIESAFLRSPVDDNSVVHADWDYLAFPVRGPYRLDQVTVVSAVEDVTWLEQQLQSIGDGTNAIWFIGRTSLPAADRLFELLRDRGGVEVVQKKRMGQLVVIEGKIGDVLTGD